MDTICDFRIESNSFEMAGLSNSGSPFFVNANFVVNSHVSVWTT